MEERRRRSITDSLSQSIAADNARAAVTLQEFGTAVSFRSATRPDMQVRVCLKVTMCRRCSARSVVRNKLLCRLGTNSRELVGASLHAGRCRRCVMEREARTVGSGVEVHRCEDSRAERVRTNCLAEREEQDLAFARWSELRERHFRKCVTLIPDKLCARSRRGMWKFARRWCPLLRGNLSKNFGRRQ